MKIVQKYGGSSLADAECVRRVAQRILVDAKNNQMLVVVSAQGKTTDALTKKYLELSDEFPSRESDALLISGEQSSAALLAATLRRYGVDAVSLNGAQIPIRASGKQGDGRIKEICTARIRKEWKQGRIVVVTGFQGITDEGDFITLGRGGSDTSAVALAAALKADRCMIFTDVDGVYSADPRRIEDAVRFDSLHEDTMLDLALHGAKVLHPRAAALAKQYQVPTEVLTSFSDQAGTVISVDAPRRTGVTASNPGDHTVVISGVLSSIPQGGLWTEILNVFSEFPCSLKFGSNVFQAAVSEENATALMKRLHHIIYK
ncbi:MAG: aspartate kinase [Clostridia bacterium]|nr:aspartate kinase [Clostridia bacterium]